MKKIIVAFLSMVFSIGSSYAGGFGKHHDGHHDGDRLRLFTTGGEDWKKCGDYEKPPVKAVPELDASNAALALALVAGVVLVVRERRRNLGQ